MNATFWLAGLLAGGLLAANYAFVICHPESPMIIPALIGSLFVIALSAFLIAEDFDNQ